LKENFEKQPIFAENYFLGTRVKNKKSWLFSTAAFVSSQAPVYCNICFVTSDGWR